ncbi:hypothetical protein [Antribacter gilvus]|uniref:hypothetical protein n=1 Tax=Antribacter gilvus TaxID=2304675 RepID=UPI000F7878F9|nr:hypothetical protein [Antribacter gilvus]
MKTTVARKVTSTATVLATAFGVAGVALAMAPASQAHGTSSGWGETFLLKNSLQGGGADATHVFGGTQEVTLLGDWDGDGVETPGIKNGREYQLWNNWAGGAPAYAFTFGPATPGTAVVGDWDGDGDDTIGVRPAGTTTFHLTNDLAAGPADVSFTYGPSYVDVLSGDWDGDGDDTIGVRPSGTNTFHLRNSLTAGFADRVVAFGRATDEAVAGDWNADGTDTIALHRAQYIYVQNTHSGGTDLTLAFGTPWDALLAGDWDGDGDDTFGVLRVTEGSCGC